MDNLKKQLNRFLSGDDVIRTLTVLPPYRNGLESIPDRLSALVDVYKLYIPNRNALDVYNRLYMAILNSLEKKCTLLEIGLQNENFMTIKGLKRYGVIGGLDSFVVTGRAGSGKTSTVQRCSDIIADKLLVSKKPYREIIPVLFIECPADGSFKSLLYSILQGVDRMLETSYFVANKHVTATIDVLLASVSNILINHVALLVIDEVERVANDSKKGVTLINYLTQLVNQSNIAVCLVGNKSSKKYFESREYLSRRTIGVSITKMEYDEYYFEFVRLLFNYQYTLKKVEFNSELANLLYKLSSGIPSILVSLFIETQRNVILSGKEELSPSAFENTFRDNFATMTPYLEWEKVKVKPKKKVVEIYHSASITSDNKQLLYLIKEESGQELTTFIYLLKDKVSVEFISL